MGKLTKEQLITKCKEYVKSKADYETNSFDVFVECKGDEEWADFVEDFKDDPLRPGQKKLLTWKECKRLIHSVEDVYADRRADAKNSAF